MRMILELAALLLLSASILADHPIKPRHAYSTHSAAGSNSFSGSFAGSTVGAGAPGNVFVGETGGAEFPFWWAGENSPFKDAVDFFKGCSLTGNCGNIPGWSAAFPNSVPKTPDTIPTNGCNNDGCSFSGNFNINNHSKKDKDTGIFTPIDISKNPFLNGEFKGVAVSTCNGYGCPGGKPQTTITTTACKGTDCKTNTQQGVPGELNISSNPLLAGAGKPFTGQQQIFNIQPNYGSTEFSHDVPNNQGCQGGIRGCTEQRVTNFGSSSSSASGAFTGSSHSSFTPQYTPENPSFQNIYNTQTSNSGQHNTQSIPTTFPGSSDIQSQFTGSPHHKQTIPNSEKNSYEGTGSQTTDFQNVYTSQGSTIGTSMDSNTADNTYAPKTTPLGGNYEHSSHQQVVKCYGQGHICVKRHLCVNGLVNNNGEGLLQVRDGDQTCDTNTEVCCRLSNPSEVPRKEIPSQIPIHQSPYFSDSQQTTSSAAVSNSASHSSTSQYSVGSSPDLSTKFSSPVPYQGTLPSTNLVHPGVYQPSKDSKLDSSPSFNQYQPENNRYQPGQTISFGGKDGTSPGLIQVVPDSETGRRTQPPSLIRPAGSTPGLTHILPNGEVSTSGTTISVTDYKDVNNELHFASTIQGPAYLPPGPSPSPSPSNFSPDLLPPNKPTHPGTVIPMYQPLPTTPRPNTYYPSSIAPTTYYPSTGQPTITTQYLPSYSGSSSGQSKSFIQTTLKPQVTNGYLPPNQIPSATIGRNEYLPPPDKQPDSNIINISVIPPNRLPVEDKDPSGTNPDGTIVRLSTPKPTDFPLNTTPYAGCAAALKCVAEEFCTAEGVISETRVVLTKAQNDYRVPLTECLDPEKGIIGKCCRDPTYIDPWPASQLGLYNPELDGSLRGQYKPDGNKGRYRPEANTNQGVKVPLPGARPFNPYEPNQIGSPSNNPNAIIRPGGYPTSIPSIPFDYRLANVPVPIDIQGPIETDYSQKVPTIAKISSESCGARHSDSTPAGLGPIDANFAEIPWQAMVLRDTNRSLLCGGAIIRRDVVLTAAHCVEGLESNDVLVKGGEWKLGIDEEPKPFQINKVATIVRHPGYRPETKLNDVALLILTEKFRLAKNVDLLCLPEPNEDVAKTFQKAKCITTGWGKTILQLNIVNSLMHILGVGIMKGSQCQQQLQQYHSDSAHLYNANCVCGAPVQQQADICDVDVGSALACERADGRYTLAGIYSWDTGCNPTAQIAGYTKVDTQWIESTLQRPIKDLRTEEKGFYTQLQASASGQECHCLQGK